MRTEMAWSLWSYMRTRWSNFASAAISSIIGIGFKTIASWGMVSIELSGQDIRLAGLIVEPTLPRARGEADHHQDVQVRTRLQDGALPGRAAAIGKDQRQFLGLALSEQRQQRRRGPRHQVTADPHPQISHVAPEPLDGREVDESLARMLDIVAAVDDGTTGALQHLPVHPVRRAGDHDVNHPGKHTKRVLIGLSSAHLRVESKLLKNGHR